MGELFKPDKAKAAGRVRPPTTTLAISGLGATEEDRQRGVDAGIILPSYVKRLNLLLYGPPGTAKTLNAHTLPRTRTLDFDDGMQSVEWAIRKGLIKRPLSEIVFKTILPDPTDFKSTAVIDEASDTLDDWIRDEDISPEEWDKPYPQFWDTLIIDSGSSLTDAAIIKALSENHRLGVSKSWELLRGKGIGVTPMRQQDWGSAASLFQKFINNARAYGKNVVLICHEYSETDDEGVLLSIDPLLIGQLRQKIPKDFDEVWYAHVKGARDKPEYLFQTTPDPRHHLRSRLGCLDPVEKADFGAIKKKIAKFYGIDESRLWTAAHGSQEIEAEQGDSAMV
jgi:hypothetical protein